LPKTLLPKKAPAQAELLDFAEFLQQRNRTAQTGGSLALRQTAYRELLRHELEPGLFDEIRRVSPAVRTSCRSRRQASFFEANRRLASLGKKGAEDERCRFSLHRLPDEVLSYMLSL